MRSNSVQTKKTTPAQKPDPKNQQANKQQPQPQQNQTTPKNEVSQAKIDQLKQGVALGFVKATSKAKKLSVEELVKERLQLQPELLKAYPNMPVLVAGEITTFQDYAYAVHDQAEFLRGAMDEIKAMHESHFMTKRNKLLMQEKKALEGELEKSKNSQDQGLK